MICRYSSRHKWTITSLVIAAVIVTTHFVNAAPSFRPGMGAIPYNDGGTLGTTFRIWAPNASYIHVAGDFNGWNWSSHPLASEGANGMWSLDVVGAVAGNEFLYAINGNDPNNLRRDPRSRKVTNSGGNSIIVDPLSYDWSGDVTPTPDMDSLVIYEMHIGTFNDSNPTDGHPGSFYDAIAKLDHLQLLGINAVSVLPVAEFAGEYSWGYNPADLFAVENNAYGGPDAFRDFIKACHQRGIIVLLDTVHNHYDDAESDLYQFDKWTGTGNGGGIYFYEDPNICCTDFGLRPDYSRPQVRDFIKDNVKMWLDEYRVDGFRWDAVCLMKQYEVTNGWNTIPDGESLMLEINGMMETNYPSAIRISEDCADGSNFDAEWDHGFHNQITAELVKSDDTARDIGAISWQMTQGDYSRVIYMESHDVVGALNASSSWNAIRFPAEIDPNDPDSYWARKRSLLGAAIQMTSPGIPMLFQGQELLEDKHFSITNVLDWSLASSRSNIVAYYRDLIRVRRNLDGGMAGLKGTESEQIIFNDTLKLLGIRRWDAASPSNDVVVLINVSYTPIHDQWVDMPAPGFWYTHFNSDLTKYGSDYNNEGVSLAFAYSDNRANIHIGPYSVLIMSRTPPSTPGDLDNDGMLDSWEDAKGLDRTDPSDGSENPDEDLFTNLEEYLNGLEPFIWDPPLSDYAQMSVAGTLNGWNPTAAYMELVHHHQWEKVIPLNTNSSAYDFKFTADGDWAANWGDNEQAVISPPLSGTLDWFGSNISFANSSPGNFKFSFNEQTRIYSVEKVFDLDRDFDGMPDAWEALYGLNATNAADAAGNLDSDLYLNIEEYENGTSPIVHDQPMSSNDTVAVTGTFNGWNLSSDQMALTNHYFWTLDLPLTYQTNMIFKFVAGGNWDTNWGDANPAGDFVPLTSTGQFAGADISFTGVVHGIYRFELNTKSFLYSITRIESDDSDADGMPDAWETANSLNTLSMADRNENPDGDLYTNVEEYQHGTDPNVKDTPLSAYTYLSIPGDFNGWNFNALPLTLTNYHQWSATVDLTYTTGIFFKVAAHGNWDTNWGEEHASSGVIPYTTNLVSYGANIFIGGLLHGTYRFEFHDGSGAISVTQRSTDDNDLDYMPNTWEILHNLNPTNAADANNNPDNDPYTNLEEYQNGFDPHLWNQFRSDYSSIAVVGTFNAWDLSSHPMILTNHYTWIAEYPITELSGFDFKYAAEESWTDNWGDWNPPLEMNLPIHDYGEKGGGDMTVNGPASGTIRFKLNTSTLEYSIEEVLDDEDNDGLPDSWELRYGLNHTNAADAHVDSDFDNISNYDEYFGDTIPTNSTSFVGVVSVIPGESGQVTISWKGGILANQYIERGIAESWSCIYTAVPPTPVFNNWTDSPPSPAVWYRIRTDR